MSSEPTASSVVVTGAASGIGRSVAAMLVETHAQVIGIDRNRNALNETKRSLGNQFTALVADISDPQAVDNVFLEIEKEFTSLTGLVNAAGIGGEPGDVTQTTPEFWNRTVNVNLTGVFLVSRRAIPLLARASGSSVVHIASQLGIVGTQGSPAYTASKGGVIALGRSMALDHAPQRIRVNVVCPGPIDTPLFEASSGPSNLEVLKNVRIPLGRIGQPEEVARLVLFLLSDQSAFMTGSIIPIDGGWTAV